MVNAGQQKSLQCTAGKGDFTATVSYDGDRRMVAIDGILSCPLPEFRLTLEHDNPGINPDPKVLVIKVVEVEPASTVPQVVTDTKIHGDFRIKPEVERVRITNLDVTLQLSE